MSKDQVSLLKTDHPRGYKWVVTYPGGSSQRKRRYFDKKIEAQGFIEIVQTDLRNHGLKAMVMGDEDRRAFADHEAILSRYGKTLRNALEFYTAHLERTERSCSVDELIDRYLTRAMKRKLSSEHRANLEGRLNRFATEFGKGPVSGIDGDEIQSWLDGLGVAPLTMKHYRAALHALFEEGVRAKVCIENPVGRTVVPKAAPSETKILTVDQAHSLLVNVRDDARNIIAIALFAGLRKAELIRLEWTEVDLMRGHILVTAQNAKSAKRRYVEISDNLKAWLVPEDGKLKIIASPQVYRKRLEEAARKSGIDPWPNNALRHSFASYHLALREDSGKTAFQLGHSSSSIVFQHYRQLVGKKEAEQYFDIRPEAGEKIISMAV
jgi:integrase